MQKLPVMNNELHSKYWERENKIKKREINKETILPEPLLPIVLNHQFFFNVKVVDERFEYDKMF